MNQTSSSLSLSFLFHNPIFFLSNSAVARNGTRPEINKAMRSPLMALNMNSHNEGGIYE